MRGGGGGGGRRGRRGAPGHHHHHQHQVISSSSSNYGCRCSCEALILRERRRQQATMAPPAESCLDVAGVYHSTAVPASEGGCCAGCLGPRPEPTAVLRDVSARVFGGEVLAVLGSKGSGKRALLDVIGKDMSG